MYVQEVNIIRDCKVLPECAVVWVDIHPLQGECPDLPQSIHMPPLHPHFLHVGTCELQLLPCGSVGLLYCMAAAAHKHIALIHVAHAHSHALMSCHGRCGAFFSPSLAVMCASVMSLLLVSHVLRIALQAKTGCLLLLDKQLGVSRD